MFSKFPYMFLFYSRATPCQLKSRRVEVPSYIDQLDDYQRPYRALEVLQKKKIIPRENALLRKVSSNRETKKLELISTGSLSQISM